MLKTSLAIFYMKMQKRKVLLMKTSKTWLHFPKTFFQNLNSCDLISWNFIDSPHIILEKKSQYLISRYIWSRDFRKLGLFYQVFSPRNFFPVTFLKFFIYFMIFTFGFLSFLNNLDISTTLPSVHEFSNCENTSVFWNNRIYSLNRYWS